MLLSRCRPALLAGGLALLVQPLPAADADLVRGERVFRMQCAGCHSVEAGAHRAGPSLYKVLGRPAGSIDGFQFSPAMEDADLVWDRDVLDAFLKNPEQVVPGTRMVFWGLDQAERDAVIRYLEYRGGH